MNLLYDDLRTALQHEIDRHHLAGKKIQIRCKALTVKEAIGNPAHDDYPIIKGREVMVEASFEGNKGQAFTDEFENVDYGVDDLLDIELSSNRNRASFISGLNAVFRYLGICSKTVHCRDREPVECAAQLAQFLGPVKNVLLVGYQPRFLESLASAYTVRALDLDRDNIGKAFSGVIIESPARLADAAKWCDMIFATGSTIVNGTLTDFIIPEKPLVLYGVTIAASAKILDLKTYCHCGA